MPILAWAQRMLQDSHLRFVNAGLPVYLRTVNVVDEDSDFAELGFVVPATDTSDNLYTDSGYSDSLIDPPPDVTPLPTKDIGLAGARLEFGPHRFLVSHTFVLHMMEALNITDPMQVWRGNATLNYVVVGLYYNQRLYAIESIVPLADGGEIISWQLDAVANEQMTTPVVGGN